MNRFKRDITSGVILSAMMGLLGCSGLPGRFPNPVVTTPRGHDESPQCDHEGRFVAYQHFQGTADSRTTGLYATRLDSLQPRLIAVGLFSGYDWIPGTDSLVVSGGGRIAVISSASGEGQVLLVHEAYNITVSSSGRHIAFDAGANFKSSLFLLDRYTGNLMNVTPDSMLYEFPDWAPSDSELVCVAGSPKTSGLFRVSPSGTPIKQLTFDAGYIRGPAWSPAGDRIAWADVQSSISLFVIDTAGVARQPIIAGGPGLSWSRGGSALVYTATTTLGSRLFEFDLGTRAKRQITF